MSNVSIILRATAVAVVTGILAGCSGDGELKKPPSQVVAKVNKSEISVHQVNGALMSAGIAVSKEQAKDISAQVLERLIDQELLVQQASDKKLDRNPKVSQALESARRQVLSQAYTEQVTASVPRPSADELRKFYAENPALFAQRRIYRLREIAVAASGDQATRIAAAAESARSANDFVGALKAQGVGYTENVNTKPSEQLPIQLLPRLATLRDGQLLSIPTSGGLAFVQVLESQVVPASEKEATPFIEQYLMNQQKMQLTHAEVRRLRGQAKIEYVGDIKPAQVSTSVQPERATTADKSGPDMNKGVSGLLK